MVGMFGRVGRVGRRQAFGLFLAVLLAGCDPGGTTDPAAPPTPEVPPDDLVEQVGYKADGSTFNQHLLVEDAVFTDADYLTETEVQAFFEASPYATRSFLADYSVGGRSAARVVVDAAQAWRINPLVLLTKLQVEMGLVSRLEAPSAYRLEHAMGCACPDGAACSAAEAGFDSQVDCAGRVFRWYLDDLAEKGSTISGWTVSKSRQTLDGEWVKPRSAATAALYTYTPWVLRGEGGNWLFWNVFQRYARHVLASHPNRGWVGGSCTENAACAYTGGTCLETAPDGLCSAACDRYCPDPTLPFTAGTFCVDLGFQLLGESAGFCVSRCDPSLYPHGDGCRDGYFCEEMPRFGQPETRKSVCLPSRL